MHFAYICLDTINIWNASTWCHEIGYPVVHLFHLKSIKKGSNEEIKKIFFLTIQTKGKYILLKFTNKNNCQFIFHKAVEYASEIQKMPDRIYTTLEFTKKSILHKSYVSQWIFNGFVNGLPKIYLSKFLKKCFDTKPTQLVNIFGRVQRILALGQMGSTVAAFCRS